MSAQARQVSCFIHLFVCLFIFFRAEAEMLVFFEEESVLRFRSASEMLPFCFRNASGFVDVEARRVSEGAV
jgi:hypothetical protein